MLLVALKLRLTVDVAVMDRLTDGVAVFVGLGDTITHVVMQEEHVVVPVSVLLLSCTKVVEGHIVSGIQREPVCPARGSCTAAYPSLQFRHRAPDVTFPLLTTEPTTVVPVT